MHLPVTIVKKIVTVEHSWQRSRSSQELQSYVRQLHARRNLSNIELDIAL